ncbi:MAG: phage integrase SAM-like domain-containing protein [Bacteroides sp.]|nr:phage integrase SAM-like domain-containing protein [Bacteroides sp.]
MSGKFKIMLYKSNKKKNGTYPVSLYLTKNGDVKWISLGLYATESQWNDNACRFNRDKRINPEYEKNNALLTSYESRANGILNIFAEENIDWTLNRFVDLFINKKEKVSVCEYFQKHIDNLRLTGHYGNANTLEDSLKAFKLKGPSFVKLQFSDLDLNCIIKLDFKLERCGVSSNTRAQYHSALRTILNLAIKDHIYNPQMYPYNKNGFSTSRLIAKTKKKEY